MKRIIYILITFLLTTGCNSKTDEKRMQEIGEKIEESGWDEPVKNTTKKSIYIKYETMDDISIEIRIARH